MKADFIRKSGNQESRRSATIGTNADVVRAVFRVFKPISQLQGFDFSPVTANTGNKKFWGQLKMQPSRQKIGENGLTQRREGRRASRRGERDAVDTPNMKTTARGAGRRPVQLAEGSKWAGLCKASRLVPRCPGLSRVVPLGPTSDFFWEETGQQSAGAQPPRLRRFIRAHPWLKQYDNSNWQNRRRPRR
jgi:hypothetical protein